MKDIFELVTSEETAYQTIPVTVADNYEWHMPEHIRATVLYKNSQYLDGDKYLKPYKNIIRPILNVQYRAEGFDVKDITLYVNDPDQYYMSFLVNKFHEKWARENHLDTFIDKMVESFVDFGGVLVKNVNDVKPEVVPLQSIAFCDQTDILSGALAIKHFYSPDQLLEMNKQGWGEKKNGATATLSEVITLAETYKKSNDSTKHQSKTPGKYVEVYEVHGMFPDDWLEDGDYSTATEIEDNKHYEASYSRQMHIITMLKDTNNPDNKLGITLFRGKEKESIFKLLLRDEIYGRALGLGGAEELFDAQVWLNYDVIRMTGMLDQAAKILYQTSDTAFANRNQTNNLENGEILITEPNSTISQINTTPVNITVFENSVKEWEAHAQQMGAANDSIMGNQPTSGTPFKLQELVTQEGHSLHEYRKGKIASFLGEIYTDWIIPNILKEIARDQQFIASLDLDELQTIAENIAILETNKLKKEKILNGEPIEKDQVDSFHTQTRDNFMKGGSKRFITILQGELQNAPIGVEEVDIAGKQKDLAAQTDKLTNVFRQIMANPAILDDPRMAKIFNQILESSGLSPIDFYQKPTPQQNAPGPKVSEAISFKDLPPDGQVQMAAQAGIKIAPPAVQQTPAMAQPTQ